MLNNFVLEPKTKIIFGKDSEKTILKEVLKYGNKCLVHYDSSEHLLPLVTSTIKELISLNVEVYELGGVLPNPRLSLIYQGIELCREKDINFVLAIGGGSVMDSAKFISFGVKADFDIWTYKSFTSFPHKVIPHGAISTLPGTGAER